MGLSVPNVFYFVMNRWLLVLITQCLVSVHGHCFIITAFMMPFYFCPTMSECNASMVTGFCKPTLLQMREK